MMTRLTLATSLVAALALAVSPAAAQERQGFRLDRYLAPPTPEDGVALQRPGTLGHLRWSAGLMLDYAHGPLVIETPDGASAPIVEHLFAGHVVAALGLAEMFEVHLRLPVVLAQGGSSPTIGGMTFQSPDVVALSDGAIGGSVRFFGDERDGFALGMAAELMLPLSGNSSLSSDTEVGARGHVMASYAVPRALTVAFSVGAAYRPERDYLSARIGSELTYGLGVYVPVIDELTLLGEVWGSTTFRDEQVFTNDGTPLEGLLGARANIEGVHITGAVGFGLTQSVGTPDVRALLGVAYAPPIEEPTPEAAGPGDRDGDGLLDNVDQCPDEPEDRDEFEDENGCPDPDNDQDGVLDQPDECPLVPEDRDGFEDENGCPDPDNDQDGVLDEPDQCDSEPEDRDAFEDENGCPDPDNDQDGFLDAVDRCPNEAEVVNQWEDEDGCPDEEPALTELRRLGMRVFFPHDRVRPTGRSMSVLRQVARLIAEHPEWVSIQIEAHASSEGEAEYNQDLSQRRGERIRDELVRRGVAADRLTVIAHGETQSSEEASEEEAAENRRVEFVILARGAPGGAAPSR